MPSKEELLDTHTHKSENFSTEKRIFYSLHKEGDQDSSKSGAIKFISLLTSKLQEKGLLTEEEIDDLLLETVY